MSADNSENKQHDIPLLTNLESVQALLWEKKFREAKKQLQEIIQREKNNREARKSLAELKKRRHIKIFWIVFGIVVVIFIITGVFLVFMGWKEVGSTEVAIDLTVNQFSFTTSERWEIYPAEIEFLTILHLNDLKLYPKAVGYDLGNNRAIKWQAINTRGPLQIKRTEDSWNVSIKSNYLKLSSLVIDSGSKVKVAIGERPNQLIMTITGGPVFGTVETADTLMVICNNCKIESHSSGKNSSFNNKLRIVTQHREIKFNDLKRSIDIRFEVRKIQSKSNQYIPGKSINIKEIDFTILDGEERESTITQEGKIYFTELDGKEFDIKEGDFVSIGGLQNFWIKRFFLENQIKVSLYGRVQELRSGMRKYSRLPSYLELWHANQRLYVSLTILISALSAILVIFQIFQLLKNYLRFPGG